MILVENFATGTSGVVDNGWKFAAGVNYTSGELSQVSMAPLANIWNNIK
jgi:hypothetical protein